MTHGNGAEEITGAVVMSPEFRTLIGAFHAKEYLEAGVTAVRVVGHSGIGADIALRDAIRSGQSGRLCQIMGRRRCANSAGPRRGGRQSSELC